jgi:hypothetical protein
MKRLHITEESRRRNKADLGLLGAEMQLVTRALTWARRDDVGT